MKILVAISAIMALVLASFGTAVTDEASGTATVTVNEFIDITITDTGAAGFAFGSLDPGTTNNNETDQVDGLSSSTAAVKVKNEATSNVDAKVRLMGTNFTDVGSNTLAVTNVDYDDDGAVDEVPPETSLAQTGMTTSYPVAAYTTLTPSSTVDIWFWLDVPTGQTAATYSSTFSFEGSST